MNGYTKNSLPALIFMVLAGCGSLNNDQMLYYTGIMASATPLMANSTARMANSTERMEAKSDGLIHDLQKRGSAAERAIQNYSQAILDNERAMIRTLQAIKQELNELKQELRPTGSKTSQEQLRRNPVLQAKLNELEDKLSGIVSKMEKNKQIQ